MVMLRNVLLLAAFGLLLTLPSTTSCAKAPPTLGPQAQIEFQNMQIGKAIDMVRDIAQDASKTTPPLLTLDVALKITNWHTAAVKTLAARGPNWKSTVLTGLDQVVTTLSQKDRDLLAPYVALVKSVLAAL